jgi:hypothetical protein
LKACSFVYSGDDEEGKGYGILDVVIVDDDDSSHIISYRADPLNFDIEKTTMDHIKSEYDVKLVFALLMLVWIRIVNNPDPDGPTKN